MTVPSSYTGGDANRNLSVPRQLAGRLIDRTYPRTLSVGSGRDRDDRDGSGWKFECSFLPTTEMQARGIDPWAQFSSATVPSTGSCTSPVHMHLARWSTKGRLEPEYLLQHSETRHQSFCAHSTQKTPLKFTQTPNLFSPHPLRLFGIALDPLSPPAHHRRPAFPSETSDSSINRSVATPRHFRR